MAVVALTAAFVRSIKPPENGRVEYWDATTPGLCLRVSASGQATWSFRYRPREGAGFQRITLGGLPSLTLAAARERAGRYRAQVIDGGDPQQQRKARREAAKNVFTFEVLAQRYIDEYAKPNKSSWKNDEGYLKRPRAAFGSKPASAVTRRDVIDILDTIRATAPVSANRTHAVLSGLFNWAIENELLEASPVVRLKKRAKETSKERTLSDDELRVLWEALDRGERLTRDVADALKLILLLGQRPGEIAGLVKSEVVAIDRPKEARIELPSERMKARRPHVTPLPSMARQIIATALERRKDDSDGQSVLASKFSSRDTLARHSLSQGLRRVIGGLKAEGQDRTPVERLQADPPTPHDLRRTIGTGLSRLGIPREDRKAVLAHSEGDVHEVYDRYDRLREKRIALEAWGRHVASVLGQAHKQGDVVPLTGRKGRAES